MVPYAYLIALTLLVVLSGIRAFRPHAIHNEGRFRVAFGMLVSLFCLMFIFDMVMAGNYDDARNLVLILNLKNGFVVLDSAILIGLLASSLTPPNGSDGKA